MLNVDRYQFYGKTEVIWSVRENNVWLQHDLRDDMPLVPGDGFNITGHLHNDSLTLLLNEAHNYSIPLGRIQDGIEGIDVSESRVFRIAGKGKLTYVNLIFGC